MIEFTRPITSGEVDRGYLNLSNDYRHPLRNHQERANTIREAFLDVLRGEGASVQKIRDLADDPKTADIRSILLALGRASREIYGVHGVGIINVHVRSEPPGWWNIVKSVKRDFTTLSAQNSFRINCYYVLLIGRNDQHVADGYIATDFDQPPFIRQPRNNEEIKYTVKECKHLDSRKLLLSVGKVARTLMQQQGTA